MPDLILHFEAPEGTDPEDMASHLEGAMAGVADVESAEASTPVVRSGGIVEVILIVKYATEVISTTAAFLTAVNTLVKAWQDLRARFPKAKVPTVEIMGTKVPIDQVTAEHAAEALGG